MAMVNHLADRLGGSNSTVGTDGTDDPGGAATADERRAAALALLADPALACTYLSEIPAQQDPAQQEPAQPEPAQPDPDADAPAAGELALRSAEDLGRTLRALGPAVVDRLRPRTVLYLHLDAQALGRVPDCPANRPGDGTAVARVEGLGPIGLAQLRSLLSHDRVTVRPVAYPRAEAAVDDYQVPRPLHEAIVLRHPYEVFPWGTLPSRRADLDHTRPFRHPAPGGPPDRPGQTGPGNLGPLSRHHHLAKTFDGFDVHQPEPGVYYWRIPTGRWTRVDRDGTHPLGTATPRAVDAHRGLSPGERHLARMLLDHTAA
jgi:hypothetical protein